MKTVEFDVYVHITGEVYMEETPDSPDDLLDAIFPDGFEGEVYGVTTSPDFCLKGYMRITSDNENE